MDGCVTNGPFSLRTPCTLSLLSFLILLPPLSFTIYSSLGLCSAQPVPISYHCLSYYYFVSFVLRTAAGHDSGTPHVDSGTRVAVLIDQLATPCSLASSR